jgi:hypothetical protein
MILNPEVSRWATSCKAELGFSELIVEKPNGIIRSVERKIRAGSYFSFVWMAHCVSGIGTSIVGVAK